MPNVYWPLAKYTTPLARSRDLNFLIISSNVSFEEILATSHPECLSVNDQLISAFLKFADLAKFKALFQRFGVYKFDHLNENQVEDLHKFGNFKLIC